MVPECLAHSAIAGSDMPFTASAFLALILLARYAERPAARSDGRRGPGDRPGLGDAAFGLVAPDPRGRPHLVAELRRPRPWVGLGRDASFEVGRGGVALGIVAFTVLWAGDGFGTVTVGESSSGPSLAGLPQRFGPIDVSRLPVPTSAVSVLKQVRHQNAGHEAYLCGSYSQSGWPSYFPIAFLLKTPVGLIALFVLAAAAEAARPRPWDAVCRRVPRAALADARAEQGEHRRPLCPADLSPGHAVRGADVRGPIPCGIASGGPSTSRRPRGSPGRRSGRHGRYLS